MDAGTALVAQVGGRTFSGTVLFANERIITMATGDGTTAIFRFDIAGNRWMQGRMTTVFGTLPPVKLFAERLQEVAEKARKLVPFD